MSDQPRALFYCVTKLHTLRHWLLLLTLMFSAHSYADSLVSSVDRNVISLQETFTLTVRFTGRTDQAPDFAPLQRDFEILNTQQSSQMRIINNRMEAYTDWRIALAAKKSGTFTIPSLQLGNTSSQPIDITVEPQSRAPQNTSSSVFVEVETDKDSAYVQEQILVTVRLFTAVPLNNVDLQPLELTDAVVVGLDERQYQTTVSGRAHAVVETRYAIFPQISGVLTLPSLTYQVTASSGQRDPWSQMYGNRSNNILRLRTDEIALNINAAPAQFSGQTWLPATKVTLSEHWSVSRDNLRVGVPVTRSITINAEGLTAGQIPPLQAAAIDGITSYPDQPQTDEQKTPQGVSGTRIETLAIVPNRSGKFTLPKVTINWWDTTQQRMQTAELPEHVLHVEDNPYAPAVQTTAPEVIPAYDEPSSLDFIPATPRTAPRTAIPLWLAATAAGATFIAIIFAWLYWRARQELVAIHGLNRAGKDQQQQAENSIWNELKRANAADDFAALRKAVLAWAQIHWQDDNLRSLHAIAERTDDKILQNELAKLDKALYSGNASGWNGGELLQQIYACRRQKRDQRREEEGLKPLYKN